MPASECLFSDCPLLISVEAALLNETGLSARAGDKIQAYNTEKSF
jgi:hypothetical protein